MSRKYALSRATDALEKSQGNHAKAHRLIMKWLEKDQTLLVGTVGPHVETLALLLVKQAAAPEKMEGTGRQPQEVIDQTDIEKSELGAALIAGLQGGAEIFGDDTPRGVGKPGKASQQHIDTINAIAGKKK